MDDWGTVAGDPLTLYLKRGNFELAASNLRSSTEKQSEQSGSCYWSGFFLGTGLALFIQGLIRGAEQLFR